MISNVFEQRSIATMNHTILDIRAVFRTQLNIYDEAVLRKQLKAFRRLLFSQKELYADARMGSKYASAFSGVLTHNCKQYCNKTEKINAHGK